MTIRTASMTREVSLSEKKWSRSKQYDVAQTKCW